MLPLLAVDDRNQVFVVPIGFAGGLQHRDTGVVRFGIRDCDPNVSRYTAKEPILFAGGNVDLYGYYLNDPVNWVEPRGQFGVAGVIVGAVAGAQMAFYLV